MFAFNFLFDKKRDQVAMAKNLPPGQGIESLGANKTNFLFVVLFFYLYVQVFIALIAFRLINNTYISHPPQ